MAHIPYENSQLFYDEQQRARGKVTEFLPRFKMIASLGAVDMEGEESRTGQVKNWRRKCIQYIILLLFYFFFQAGVVHFVVRVDLFKNLSLFT